MIRQSGEPWPWNKLPKPRPADWGVGMTVCIASVCANDAAIVMVSDRMVSMGGIFSGDWMTRKADPIAFAWGAQFAGNDISPAIPIVNYVRQNGAMGHPSLGDMVSVVKAGFRAQRLQQIEDEILSAYGMTWDEFKVHGKERLSDRGFDRLIDRIAGYEMSLEFLVSGYDSKGEPHVFTVESPSRVNYYDKLGFWAIGSGQHQAVGSLFATHYSRGDSLEEGLTKALIAKFNAESSLGVGKSTFVVIDLRDALSASAFISLDTLTQVRGSWDAMQKLPTGIVEAIKGAVDASVADAKKRNEDRVREIMPLIARKSEGQQ